MSSLADFPPPPISARQSPKANMSVKSRLTKTDDPQVSFAHRQDASSAVHVPEEVESRQSVAHESRLDSSEDEPNGVGGEVGTGEGAIVARVDLSKESDFDVGEVGGGWRVSV